MAPPLVAGRLYAMVTHMLRLSHHFKSTLTSFALAVGFSLPLAAQEAPSRLDRLLGELAEAEPGEDRRLVEQIFVEWSKSGSPTVDLLLSRGQEALEAGDHRLAVDHFTAAIDYAPDFAEAYHGRATAYYLTDQIGPALEDLAMVLRLEPRHFRAMRGFAVVLEEMGQKREALEVLRQVRLLHPADPETLAAQERLAEELEGRAL